MRIRLKQKRLAQIGIVVAVLAYVFAMIPIDRVWALSGGGAGARGRRAGGKPGGCWIARGSGISGCRWGTRGLFVCAYWLHRADNSATANNSLAPVIMHPSSGAARRRSHSMRHRKGIARVGD